MSLPLLAGVVIIVLGLGYRFYGRFIAAQYNLDPNALTPAHQKNDGVDFVPTKPFYLLGQHFSAIAAAGPIAGPIFACKQFGWGPAVLWIVLGVVFIGAVHDLSTLIASVRHEGKSIAEVVKTNLGPRSGAAMLAFIWVALIYVIVAFVDVTANTFVSGDADLKGLTFKFNPGGAVAMSSVLYLGLAIAMGFVDRYLKPKLWLQTVIFVPLTLVAVWGGTQLSTVLLLPHGAWAAIILAYCFIASMVPVWALLQPRGYLGGFVLYFAIAIGTIGLFFGGFQIQQPMFTGFNVGGPTGALFPFLFVTIACGACSGFHGLVCTGTTSKQLDKEPHVHPVGYGAMLLEAFVALIALATIMIVSSADTAGKAPGTIYGEGLGRFLVLLIGERNLPFAVTFGAMAFSTFVFDTLDVSTRLGRYIFQELFGLRHRFAPYMATAMTVGVPLGFVAIANKGAYLMFWTLFGTSNQMLAALSLMGISVWLKNSGKRYWYTLGPAVFVSVITLWSLFLQILGGVAEGASVTQRINAGVSLVLMALALTLLARGAWALSRRTPPLTPLPASAAS